MQSRKIADEYEWCGPAAQTLKRKYNCESPVPLFIEKAREIVLSSKIAGPPFDPLEYAKHLKIAIVEKETMAPEGLLTQNERGQFIIHLKRDIDPPYRKNFTIAHEIAHTFFYEELVEVQSSHRPVYFDKEEEKLCNKAAAELLMPFSHFKTSLLKDGGFSPRTLLSLSNEYQASLQAVSIRTWEVTRSFACALWREDGHTINLEWITPKGMRGLILCQTGKSSIETALKRPSETFTKRDTFYKPDPNGSKMIRRITSSSRISPIQVLSIIPLKNDC